MIALTALCLLTVQDSEARALEALRIFKREFEARDAKDAARCAAVRRVSAVRHPKVLRVLAPFLALGPDALRIATAESLGRFRKVPGTTATLLAALDHGANRKKKVVRLAVVRALGDLNDPGALERLHKLVTGRDVQLAAEAARALGKIRKIVSVPVLIRVLRVAERNAESMRSPSNPMAEGAPWTLAGAADAAQQAEQRERRAVLLPAVLDALRMITGKRFRTARDWESWWQKGGRP